MHESERLDQINLLHLLDPATWQSRPTAHLPSGHRDQQQLRDDDALGLLTTSGGDTGVDDFDAAAAAGDGVDDGGTEALLSPGGAVMTSSASDRDLSLIHI